MPKSEIPSVAISITPASVSITKLARLLRTGAPAVVGTVIEGKLHLDLRTVFEHQDRALTDALAKVLG